MANHSNTKIDYTKGYTVDLEAAPESHNDHANKSLDFATHGVTAHGIVPNNTATVAATVLLTTDTDPELNKVYSRARGVRFVSIIDGIVAFIGMMIALGNSSAFWPAYFLGLCALMGYYGAKKYDRCLLSIYIIYQFFRCLGDFIIIFNPDNSYVILSVIIFLIELYIFQYTIKLYMGLGKLTVDKLKELKDGWTPVRSIVYYW